EGEEYYALPLDIITIEKSDSFVWVGEIEVVYYYNEDEVMRYTVDFSTSYNLYLPYIQMGEWAYSTH
ncbi:MAG: hypothetical protein AAF639_26740, partial [Chloroflexota bacterium]